MSRTKFKLAGLVAALAFSGAAHATVIACDVGSTGSTQYPNVSCTSNGYLNVNTTVSGSGPTTGSAANGAAVSGNPVLVAGYDGTLTRTLLTDTSGRAIVNVNGTVPVSGTFWQATQPVSISSGTIQPGDWDAQCIVQFVPASTTTLTAINASVSTTSGTLGAYSTLTNQYTSGVTGATIGTLTIASPVVQEKLTTATTVYCVAQAVFGTSTLTANGTLRYRRAQ